MSEDNLLCVQCGMHESDHSRIGVLHAFRPFHDKLPTADMVNQPPHYTETRIECLDAIEAMVEKWPGEAAYLGGNVLKYVWRHPQKAPVESLRKARFYLDRLIKLTEATEHAR